MVKEGDSCSCYSTHNKSERSIDFRYNLHYIIPEDGIAPGGRLQAFHSNWEKITNHQWPLSVVKDGFKIQFRQQPAPWKLNQIHLKEEDQHAVDEAVQKFLTAQIIELSPSQNTGF